MLIVIKAEITTAEKIKQLVTERRPLRFPNDDDFAKIDEFFKGLRSQISLPNTLLSEALNKTSDHYIEIVLVVYSVVLGGANLPVINTVFRNLASVLPNVSWNELVFQFLYIFMLDDFIVIVHIPSVQFCLAK